MGATAMINPEKPRITYAPPLDIRTYVNSVEQFAYEWQRRNQDISDRFPPPATSKIQTLLEESTRYLALQKSGRFLPPFHSAVKDETLNKAAEILAARNKNLAEEIEAFKQSYLKTSREKTLENHIGDCLQKIVIRHALMQRAEQEILKLFNPRYDPQRFRGYCTTALMKVLRDDTAKLSQFDAFFADDNLEDLTHPESLVETLTKINKKYVSEGRTDDSRLGIGDIVVIPAETDENGIPRFHALMVHKIMADGSKRYISFDNDRINHMLSSQRDCRIIRTGDFLRDLQNDSEQNLKPLEEIRRKQLSDKEKIEQNFTNRRNRKKAAQIARKMSRPLTDKDIKKLKLKALNGKGL